MLKRQNALGHLLSLTLLILLSGCVTDNYEMRPTENVRVTPGLKKGATYRVPVVNPAGYIRLFTEGVTRLEAKTEEAKVPVVHVRMIVHNEVSPVAWSMRVSDQIISYPNGEKGFPVYVNTHSDQPPEIAAGPGEKQIVDLYYLVPVEYQGEKELVAFQLNWRVKLANEVVVEVTPFEKIQEAGYPVVVTIEREAPYVDGDADLGFGEVWWRDPSEPQAAAPPLW